MNKVELVGRITSDPEIKQTQGNEPLTIARFSLAVNRRFKNSEGNYDADFPRCIAFGKTAEFIEKYFKKGMAIGIIGRIQTGSYAKDDGTKVYTTDVVVEETEFVESKKASQEAMETSATKNTKPQSDDGFMNIPDAIDEELPFS